MTLNLCWHWGHHHPIRELLLDASGKVLLSGVKTKANRGKRAFRAWSIQSRTREGVGGCVRARQRQSGSGNLLEISVNENVISHRFRPFCSVDKTTFFFFFLTGFAWEKWNIILEGRKRKAEERKQTSTLQMLQQRQMLVFSKCKELSNRAKHFHLEVLATTLEKRVCSRTQTNEKDDTATRQTFRPVKPLLFLT